jgi:hypothetical protein
MPVLTSLPANGVDAMPYMPYGTPESGLPPESGFEQLYLDDLWNSSASPAYGTGGAGNGMTGAMMGGSFGTAMPGMGDFGGLTQMYFGLLACVAQMVAASEQGEGGAGLPENGDAPLAGGAQGMPGMTGMTGGSGNTVGIAQSLLGKSAATVVSSQAVPMQKGVSTCEDCANFVSAVLVKAGKLPKNQQTITVRQLHSELKSDGWKQVNHNNAKPGDVCIVGDDQHVEIVASNDNGKITLIGSNNTDHGTGPQVVSYDKGAGNKSDVVFLAPPA